MFTPSNEQMQLNFQGQFNELSRKFDELYERERKQQTQIAELQSRLLQAAGSPQMDRIYKVVLEEKFFRRVDKFSGETGKFRTWLFDLEVALGAVDSELQRMLHNFLGVTHRVLSVMRNWEENLPSQTCRQGLLTRKTQMD